MEIKALLTSIWQEHVHFIASQRVLVILDKYHSASPSLSPWPSFKPGEENHRLPGTSDLDLESRGVQSPVAARRVAGIST